MAPRRWIALALGALAAVAGVFVAAGPPRLTLLNAGLRVDYPWLRGTGALVAGAGMLLAALVLPRRWARIAGSALALAGFVSGASLLSYRLEADDTGLRSRSLFSRTTIAWPEVSRVQSGPERIIVWGNDPDTQVRVDTSSFRPEQRAAFDRTLARRLREADTSTRAPK